MGVASFVRYAALCCLIGLVGLGGCNQNSSATPFNNTAQANASALPTVADPSPAEHYTAGAVGNTIFTYELNTDDGSMRYCHPDISTNGTICTDWAYALPSKK